MRKVDRIKLLAMITALGMGGGIATRQTLMKELRSHPESTIPSHIVTELKDKAASKRERKNQQRIKQFGMHHKFE